MIVRNALRVFGRSKESHRRKPAIFAGVGSDAGIGISDQLTRVPRPRDHLDKADDRDCSVIGMGPQILESEVSKFFAGRLILVDWLFAN